HGHTYNSDGSLYFKISTLPQYGQLARLDHDGLKAGARVDADNYDKENARDFVLWKATKPTGGQGPPGQIDEPPWDLGVGPGRPSSVSAALPAAVHALSQAAEIQLGRARAGGAVGAPAGRFSGKDRSGSRTRLP